MKKGIFVGEFSVDQIDSGADRIAVEKVKAETGLSYTNTEIVKKCGVPVGLKIWVCTASEMQVL